MQAIGQNAAAQMSSVLRSFRVLEEVARRQPVSVGELVKIFNLPKSTLQRTLTTLQAAGWLRQTSSQTSTWEVTGRALTIQPRTLNGGALYTKARVPMTQLRDAVQETIHLSILDGLNSMILIDRVDCNQVVRIFSAIGEVSPLHATAQGKAVLAHLSNEDLNTVLARDLKRYSPHTLTSEAELRADLAEIRTRGYSLNISEYRSSVCAIGAPIFDAEGAPVASVCISMPAERFDPARAAEMGELTAKAAHEISSY